MAYVKPYIVITSIFDPSAAVWRFAAMPGYRLIVAGDKKSPDRFDCAGATYLSPEAQEQSGYRILGGLPWNHYSRKMVGYLAAMSGGADAIIDTDDDNIPYDDWSFPPFDGRYESTRPGLGFVNIYRRFTGKHIWPRGLPLSHILRRETAFEAENLTASSVPIGVWQGLADGDPDVDAIYRLTSNEACTFDKAGPVVLDTGTVSPFNSQNTAFARPLFPLLYLPAFVTFRFTDILRGLVAQPILWAAGYRLGFCGATVFQERNPHDYVRDFESEIPCYLHVERVLELASAAVSSARGVRENLACCYDALAGAGIVTGGEVELVRSWIADVESVCGA